jgi:hypothetical protein
MQTYREVEVWLHAFFTSELDGGEWLTSCHGHFTPEERTVALSGEEAGVDSTASLDLLH